MVLILGFIIEYHQVEFTEDELNKYSQVELLALLTTFRIIENAYDQGKKGHGAEKTKIENLRQRQQEIKTYLENPGHTNGHTVDDSDDSSIISLIFSKNTALAATSLLAIYFGYSYYFSKTEKAN